MNYFLLKTVTLAGLIFLAACGGEEKITENSIQTPEEQTTGNEDLHVQDQGNAPYADQNIPAFSQPSPALQKQVNNLLGSYLELKKSLIESSAENASKAASKLKENINSFSEKNVPEEQQSFYKKRVDDMDKYVSYLSQTKELEDQREHFSVITKHIYELSKAFDAHQQTLYYQYCPMAFGNSGGYWLSDSKEILNPYFGEKMLKCGHVTEEIRP